MIKQKIKGIFQPKMKITIFFLTCQGDLQRFDPAFTCVGLCT